MREKDIQIANLSPGRKKGKKGFLVPLRTIKMPKFLIEAVETFIIDNPESGYVTSSEFIREATRERLAGLKKQFGSIKAHKFDKKVK